MAASAGAACTLCPRRCGARRGQAPGRCGAGPLPRVNLAAPHFHEEPAISGSRGSGAVFFTGCALGCRFCQNHAISRGQAPGEEMDEAALAGVFLRLQGQGVHNLNLVTASHHRPVVLAALRRARAEGLALPAVWNTGGYENPDAAEALAEDIQIHLADLKFFSPGLSAFLADAPDYFAHASRYLRAACALCGPPRLGGDGLLQSGVVVRLLVLPGQSEDALCLLRWMAEALPPGGFLLSLMSQYTPPSGLGLPKPLDRRLASYECRKVQREALALGLCEGWFQGRVSASEAYLPGFLRQE